MIRKSCFKLLTGLMIAGFLFSAYGQTPVQKHGKLSTSGPYLLNEHGQIVQLRGMSFFWSRSDWGGTQFYTKDWVKFLKDDWKCTVLRVAYDRNEGNNNGWNEVKTVIDACIEEGIYVIIDWHSHTAHNQQSAAVEFFSQQARLYKNTPNVIFEPYNEPIVAGSAEQNDGSIENAKKTWAAIKPYLKAVTKAIRNEGADNLVILGTPYYAQHVGVAANDPVVADDGKPFKNVAYAFHFYAASHGPNAYYVKQGDGTGGYEPTYLSPALGKVPIFISEWGTSHSDGGQDGHNHIDGENTDWWFNRYINGEYHISHCNWSVSDFQTSSAFSGGRNPSASGALAKKWISTPSVDSWDRPDVAGKDGTSKDTVISMPGTHSAAWFNKYYGAGVDSITVPFGRTTRDTDDPRETKNKALAISKMGEINWADYNINSKQETKFIHLRYRAENGSGEIDISIGSTSVGKIEIAKSSSWTTLVKELNVPSGTQTLKFNFSNTSGSYWIEWFELTNEQTVAISFPATTANEAKIDFSVLKNGFNAQLPQSHGFSSYSIVAPDGRIIKGRFLNQNITRITLENMANGVFFLKLNRINGSGLTKTFIINH